MAQQTAVDWLFEQIPAEWSSSKSAFDAYQQAKQMEEEQHKETFKQSRQAKIFEEGMPPVWENFKQYYNETYGTTDRN
jgi:hypothetical protein